MAYQALYRTYRPSAFDEMVGQDHIRKTLENAVKQNKIGHAYLFCGPRGTGKTTVARIFAKAVNCQEENAPCNECESCIAIQNGTHPDIIEIDAASNNGVDSVRDLVDKVKYAPQLGKYKIYIIDEVHMMSVAGFNALLKTLEEPPEYVIFILATTDPQKVLPTIVSRCQRFDFNKIKPEDIMNRIRIVLEKENIDSDEESIKLIASLAEGGMRDALSILDQCIAFSPNRLDSKVINEVYGIASYEEKVNLLSYVKSKDTVALLELFRRYVSNGIDIKRFSNDLIELLKETIIYKRINGEGYKFQCPIENLNILANELSEKQCFSYINILLETNEKLRSTTNAVSYFELCLLKMTQEETMIMKNDVSFVSNQVSKPTNEKVAVMKNKIEALDMEFVLNLLIQGNKPAREFVSKAFDRIEDYLIDKNYRVVARWLQHAKVVACDNETYVLLSVEHPTSAGIINDEANKEKIVRFMRELLGTPQMVFAIDDAYQKRAVNEFVKRRNENKLPQPIPIEVMQIKDDIEGDEMVEVENKFKELCGEIFVVEE